MRDLYIEPVNVLPLDFINQTVFDASDTAWWNQCVQLLGYEVMKSWLEADWDWDGVLNMTDVSEEFVYSLIFPLW